MRTIFTLIACCMTFCLMAQQQPIKIFTENKTGGYLVYGSNTAYCPMTISLDLGLTNLKFSEGEKKIFVLPARTEKFKIGELDVVPGAGKFKYSFKYQFVYGNTELTRYDEGYAYHLPYAKGQSFNIFQGYNGAFSHQNENAIDFSMPEGTPILAAREGVVIDVVQHNNQSCTRPECMKYNNMITIYHPDGTIADYGHIQYNGSKVKVGDAVKQGDVIALSGNTGWSSGPHLHFVTYLPGFGSRKTVPTKFRIGGGKPPAILKEKETYTRDY